MSFMKTEVMSKLPYDERLKRNTTHSIDAILADARRSIVRDSISVSSQADRSYITLMNTPESGKIRDLEKDAAFVHKKDAYLVAFALVYAALNSRRSDKISYQDTLLFPIDRTFDVVRALLEASKHKGPLQFYDKSVPLRPYRWN